MRHALLISTLAATMVCAGPAGAELRDIVAQADGETGRIWLAFDEQPSEVTLEASGAALNLRIGGVRSADRLVSPSDRSLVDAIRIGDAGDGAVTVRLQGHGGWQDARAELRRGGVLVTLDLAEAVHLSGPETPVRTPNMAGSSGAGGGTGAGSQPGAEAPASQSAPSSSMPSSSTPPSSTPAPQGAAGDTAAGGEPSSQADTGSQEAQPSAAGAQPDAPAVEAGAGAAPAAADAGGDCADEAAAVAENPWDDDSLHRHAACLTNAGELDAAAIIYEQMLAFAPDDFRALIALAEVRAEQGENAAAQELYSQAASFAISDAEAARARARLRELQQR